jgi:uncharacterized membrane protein
MSNLRWQKPHFSMQRILFFAHVLAGSFVWLTSGGLPSMVASHFGAGGNANGFLSKTTYTTLMLAAVMVIPSLIGFSGQLVRVAPLQSVNLPNKEYWLAPQRRTATFESLSSMSVLYVLVLTFFICFVHWLVVQANAVQPARLSEGSLFAGLAGFSVTSVLWLVALYRRFSHIP